MEPLSVLRSVRAVNRETFPQTDRFEVGPAAGLWQALVSANNQQGEPNYNPAGSRCSVTASQRSAFDAVSIAADVASVIDYGSTIAPNAGVAFESVFQYTFRVSEPCDYSAAIQVSADSSNQSALTLLLRRVGGANVFSSPTTAQLSGRLEPGDYFLNVLLSGAATGITARDSSRTVSLAFTVPAPGAGGLLIAGLAAAAKWRQTRSSSPS